MTHVCVDADPPPKGKQDAPKCDMEGELKHHDVPAKELKQLMIKEKICIKGSINDLRKRCKNHKPPVPTKKKFSKVVKGCVGAPIGLLELLWRRGYIDPCLSNKNLPNDKACRVIARDVTSFKEELSEIELVMNQLDVEVKFLPKGHYEIARRGVECLWGVSRVMFRKENAKLDTDKRVNTLKQRVKTLLTNMPLETIQKCSRRAREHKLSYLFLLENDSDNEDLKLVDIEKVKKEIKNKRCAMDQDYSLVKKMAEAVNVDNDNVNCKETWSSSSLIV